MYTRVTASDWNGRQGIWKSGGEMHTQEIKTEFQDNEHQIRVSHLMAVHTETYNKEEDHDGRGDKCMKDKW